MSKNWAAMGWSGILDEIEGMKDKELLEEFEELILLLGTLLAFRQGAGRHYHVLNAMRAQILTRLEVRGKALQKAMKERE